LGWLKLASRRGTQFRIICMAQLLGDVGCLLTCRQLICKMSPAIAFGHELVPAACGRIIATQALREFPVANKKLQRLLTGPRAFRWLPSTKHPNGMRFGVSRNHCLPLPIGPPKGPRYQGETCTGSGKGSCPEVRQPVPLQCNWRCANFNSSARLPPPMRSDALLKRRAGGYFGQRLATGVRRNS